MLIIMSTSGVFNPATMNPASIVLPTIEHFNNSSSLNYIDIIIIILFFILIVLLYLRTTNKI